MYVTSSMMEKIQPAKDHSQLVGRVTTDAVHRRFIKSKKTTAETSEKSEKNELEEYNYCKQCNQDIKTSGTADLKFHFESVKHKPFASCVYCFKPVYEYKYKKDLRFYHQCVHD